MSVPSDHLIFNMRSWLSFPTRYWALSWTLLLLLLNRPLIMNAAVPDTDSSVFMYIAQHIVHGGAPYRDMFDHKGPLIYWINALPFWFGVESLRGIAILETVGQILSVCALGQVLHRKLGTNAVWVGLMAFCACITWSLGSGNYVEEWALMLACVAVWAVFTLKNNGLSGAIVGLCTAGALLLRPNEALFGFILLGVVWRFEPKSLRPFILGFGVAMLLVLELAAAILARQNALQSAYEQYWIFNVNYSQASWTARFGSLWKGLEKLATRGALLLAAWGVVLFWNKRSETDESLRGLLWFGVFSFVLQMASASLSGIGFTHYFIGLTLPIAILSAYALYQWKPALWKTQKVATVLGLMTLGIGLAQIVKGITIRQIRNHRNDALLSLIQTASKPADPVTVWGNTVSWLLLSNRKSATRAVYQVPLFHPAFPLATQYQSEFFKQLATNPPKLFIDGSQLKLIASPDRIPPLRDFLRKNYRVLARVPDENEKIVTVWIRK